MPTVSVLLPSYNHEKYVGRTIESVLNQTFGDLELIIVDDCSRDNSAEIIKGYMAKDSRIKAKFHSKNMGISRTMNDALSMATGEYVAFFSSDDEWFKHKLERQLEVLREEPEAVVWSDGLLIDESGKPIGKKHSEWVEEWLVSKKAFRNVDKIKKEGFILFDLLREDYVCGQSVITKREHFEEDPYDESLVFSNEYLIMIDLAGEYSFRYIDEPLIKYRLHGGNTIYSDVQKMNPDQIALRKVLLRRFSEEMPDQVKAYTFKEISNFYLALGQTANAIRFLQHAAESDPADRSIRVNALRTEWGVGTYHKRWLTHADRLALDENGEEKLVQLDEALCKQPGDARLWVERGCYLYTLSRFDQALMCIDRALELESASSEFMTIKGDILATTSDRDAALECYGRALDIDDADVSALIGSGALHCQMHHFKGGLGYFDRALAIDTQDMVAVVNRSFCLLEMGRLDEAMEGFYTVIKADPTNSSAWVGIGNVQVELEKMEEALDSFQKAYLCEPDDVESTLSIAGLLAWKGRYQEANRFYDKALDIVGNMPFGWMRKGLCQESLGSHIDALFCYFRACAIEADGDDHKSMASMHRGAIMKRIGNLAEALDYYEKAVEICGDNVDALVSKGSALVSAGRAQEALVCFSEALEIDPWATDAQAGKNDALRDLERID